MCNNSASLALVALSFISATRVCCLSTSLWIIWPVKTVAADGQLGKPAPEGRQCFATPLHRRTQTTREWNKPITTCNFDLFWWPGLAQLDSIVIANYGSGLDCYGELSRRCSARIARIRARSRALLLEKDVS